MGTRTPLITPLTPLVHSVHRLSTKLIQLFTTDYLVLLLIRVHNFRLHITHYKPTPISIRLLITDYRLYRWFFFPRFFFDFSSILFKLLKKQSSVIVIIPFCSDIFAWIEVFHVVSVSNLVHNPFFFVVVVGAF